MRVEPAGGGRDLGSAELGVPGAHGYRGAHRSYEPRRVLWLWEESEHNVAGEVTTGDIEAAIQSPRAAWLSQVGIHEAEQIRDVGQALRLHALSVEDILNTEARPKVERHAAYTFVVAKGLWWRDGELDVEHVALSYSDGIVATFQEAEQDVFGAVGERVERGVGRVRERGSEYLAFALLDTLVDGYLEIVEAITAAVDALEADQKRGAREDGVPEKLHRYKTQTTIVRQHTLPLRDGVARLLADRTDGLQDANVPFFRDLLDHLNQVLDSTTSLRDNLTGLLGLHLALVSQATNEDMRVLTVIATVFIPLTFIAGIYGMNFKHMPELEWRFGYPALWGVMILIGLVLGLYFRRRSWL